MKTIGLIILVACLMLLGNDSFAIELNSSTKTQAQKPAVAVSTPLVQEAALVIVKCPPKAGVKTYGDGGWTGVDHANTYALKSNSVYGNRMFCNYAGPQGFNFDLSLLFTYKNCVANPGGAFECQK